MPQRIACWIYFMILLGVNVLIFMNFVIALINETFGEVSEVAEEESFMKKCAILGELNSVFGGMVQQSSVDILVTRLTEHSNEAPDSGQNDAFKILKKHFISDRIEVSQTIQNAQKDLSNQKTHMLQKIESISDMLLEMFPVTMTNQTGVST